VNDSPAASAPLTPGSITMRSFAEAGAPKRKALVESTRAFLIVA